jgi:hypothetical protein
VVKAAVETPAARKWRREKRGRTRMVITGSLDWNYAKESSTRR